MGERVSSSGSGEWYSASEAGLERPVSILLASLPDDASAAGEVRERARRLAAVTDARLLPVYGQGDDEEVLWLATRRVGGRSLAEIERIETPRAARLGCQLARQVAALQEAGLAPDLVTAEDVLVEGAGEDERAWLLPAPGRPASDDASTATRSLVELLNERAPKPLLGRPSFDPETLAEELAPLTVEGPLRRWLLVGAVGLVLLVGFAALAAVLIRDSGSSDENTPPATIAARIPLGATLQGLTAADDDVWAATPSGTLINVDIESEAVVGAPLKLLPKDPFPDLVSDGDSIWVGAVDILLRLDSATGRVLERQRLGQISIMGVLAEDESIWLTATEGRSPLTNVFRFTQGSDRAVLVGPGGSLAVPVEVRGETVWALGGDGTLTRVRVRSAPTSIAVGIQAGFPTRHDGKLWIPTRDRTLVAVDPVRMTIERTVHFVTAEPYRAVTGADSIWVLTRNPSEIHRIDPATGQFLGPPLEAPADAVFIRFGGGSLWVDDPKAKALVRLDPSTPAPKPRAQQVVDDLVLRNGPVPSNVRLRVTELQPNFSFETSEEGWLAAGLDRNAVAFELLRYRRPGGDLVGVNLVVTNRGFGPGGRLEPVRKPADFVRVLRRNRSIRIEKVAPATLDGRPGLRVRFATVPQPPFPDLCPAECVVLFPIPQGSFILLKGTEEFTIVKHAQGVLIVDASFSTRTDPAIARKINRLIDSIQFER